MKVDRPNHLLQALAVGAVVLSLALAGCRSAPRVEEAGPSFDLAALDGSRVQSTGFAGRVLLVEFWATWCTPCVAQARILEPLHRDFEARGVEFVAISVGEDRETVANYVADRPFPYAVLIDPADELSARIGIYGLPTVMIIDQDGQVAYQQTGLSSGEVLRRVLEEQLAGPAA